MTFDQAFLFALLGVLFALLIWGRIRYDVLAFGALVVGSLAGVVPNGQAFSGFGHPATIIVAIVLVVSRGLSNAGAIDLFARQIANPARALAAHIAIMSGAAAALSMVMNNVAALALLMPIDIRCATKAKRTPALSLMPLSFASILGGMITLIGTPTNVVIATFREQALGQPYSMFDFAPVGLVVAAAGVAFVALVGWRLIPVADPVHSTSDELRDLKGYLAEATVPAHCKALGQPLSALYPLAEDSDVCLIGLTRGADRLPGTGADSLLEPGDVVVVEGAPEAIEEFVGTVGLEYGGLSDKELLRGPALALAEVVVPADALIEGSSTNEVGLLHRHGVMLLAVSRRGRRFRNRVRKLRIRAGDILLLYGPEERLAGASAWLGCLPLAERGLRVVQHSKAWPAIALFAAAIVAASLEWVYLPIALAAVVLGFVALRIVSLSQLYEAIEWKIIVLLGSLIPLGVALETSGGAGLIADKIIGWTHGSSPVTVLTICMLVTMLLSGILNNVATALIAAPISVDVAARLGVDPDPFLMGVAVAASCAFLTPIGHKNNTIIMGPGGYRFGDYWRMGLPLEIVVLLVGVPMILWVWPL